MMRVRHPAESRATMIAMIGSASRIARVGAHPSEFTRSERRDTRAKFTLATARSVLQPDRPERKLMNRNDR